MEGNRFILCNCSTHPSNCVEVLGLRRQPLHWLASGVGTRHRALSGSPGSCIDIQAQIILHPHGQVGHKVCLHVCHSPRHMLLAWPKLEPYSDGYAHLFAAWRSRMERLSARRTDGHEPHLKQFSHCHHVVFLAHCHKVRYRRPNLLRRVASRMLLGAWGIGNIARDTRSLTACACFHTLFNFSNQGYFSFSPGIIALYVVVFVSWLVIWYIPWKETVLRLTRLNNKHS